MPGVHAGEHSRGKIQNSGEDRDEHHVPARFGHVAARGGYLRVRFHEHPIEGLAVPRNRVAQNLLGHRHEEGRRHALARHVGNREEEPRGIEQQEIIEIAADHPRRFDQRVDLDVAAFGRAGKSMRQKPHLDRSRGIEFALETSFHLTLMFQLDRETAARRFGGA